LKFREKSILFPFLSSHSVKVFPQKENLSKMENFCCPQKRRRKKKPKINLILIKLFISLL